ncbi:hypothetical protein L1987_59237 [Smallanthus sonchifolius]|uniref:Uncharacterized protein n=1 Tax=Smallanthus sonchifolius TaxID=185202 RepID=A0ACB9D4N9_9ASTR|nr:hypothetical protein L1987_59237 [Smallanthus sonchifolius]
MVSSDKKLANVVGVSTRFTWFRRWEVMRRVDEHRDIRGTASVPGASEHHRGNSLQYIRKIAKGRTSGSSLSQLSVTYVRSFFDGELGDGTKRVTVVIHFRINLERGSHARGPTAGEEFPAEA